ncbi:MAG: FG-GAP repeat domain-containing protein, partial [Planctomycetota bacterium]
MFSRLLLLVAVVGVVAWPARAAVDQAATEAAGTGDDTASCTHPLFVNPRYAAGDGAQSVAIGDLDGVNGPDLAVANWRSDGVSVLLNQGDGTFAAPVAYAAGHWPRSVAVGDLDGINGPDLAVASGGGYPDYYGDVSVLLNQGDGTFAAAAAYAAGTRTSSVAIGDLDGVNGPDLAVANNGAFPDNDGDVAVLLNQGDGTFAAAVAYGAGDRPHSVAIGDLDGANGPDLAVANYSSDNVSVLLNQGDGTFAVAAAYGAGKGPAHVAVGDLDGVNGPDLAVADSGVTPHHVGHVSVLLNQGDGTFAEAAVYAAGEMTRSVAIGDLDGVDGPDLAVTNSLRDDDVWVLLNQGDGTFAAAAEYPAGDGPSVAVGDLDGVNGPDLAVANASSDDVSVLLNQGDGTFAMAPAYAAGDGPTSVAVGDLDGINGPDLAVANDQTDSASVLLNQGDGTFAAAGAYGAGNRPLSVAIGDLDGVNGPDLAVASVDEYPQYDGDLSVL